MIGYLVILIYPVVRCDSYLDELFPPKFGKGRVGVYDFKKNARRSQKQPLALGEVCNFVVLNR